MARLTLVSRVPNRKVVTPFSRSLSAIERGVHPKLTSQHQRTPAVSNTATAWPATITSSSLAPHWSTRTQPPSPNFSW